MVGHPMTPTEQDKELRALLDEFVLYMDSSPESNEPTELKLFLEQCGFPDAIDRLYSELMQLITADRKRVALEARIDEIKLTKDNSEESYLGEDWWADESIKDNSAHEVPLSYFENRIAELKAQKEQL